MRADNLTQRFGISGGNNDNGGFQRKDAGTISVRGPTKIIFWYVRKAIWLTILSKHDLITPFRTPKNLILL